jgi:hypothetical protein
MISEKAAFNYALLSRPVALYPRSIFQDYFPLTEADYSPDTLNHLQARLTEYREQEQDAEGQNKAFLCLLIQGVESTISFLENTDFSDFDAMRSIETYYGVVQDYYQNRLGLAWIQRAPYIVNQYPEPAQDANWFASSNVPGGPRPGYPEGVYFLRRHMMPGVVELATLHENVHHLGLGNDDVPGDYYRFFDEGCANFLAYLVYYHHNRSLEAVRLYRAFLQEINTDLYESPSFDRIMASLIQQVGMVGLYRLITRRIKDRTSVDWRGILEATAAGQLKVEPQPGEPVDADLPPVLSEMQTGADKIIAQIIYPERMLMSPLAYLTYDQMCRVGTVSVDELRAKWHVSVQALEAMIEELASIYYWIQQDDQLKPFPDGYNTDLFHGTGIMRATVQNIELSF